MFDHFPKAPDPKIVQTDLDNKSMDLRKSHGLWLMSSRDYYAESPERGKLLHQAGCSRRKQDTATQVVAAG